jgi:DMSO/TMAO reductase YedYZ molybdopterin-dependent catalytic subunit
MGHGMYRRSLLAGTGAALASTAGLVRPASAQGAAIHPGLASGTRDEAVMDTLPGKKPLIKLTFRPPNYESPLQAFVPQLTPNDQFFVRYHLSQIPDAAALADWSLAIGGDAAGKPVKLTLADLQRLPQHDVVAVCQCSGNRRGLSNPHVPGVQWGVGAMGCALWRGPRLRDVLALAGINANAVEVAARGADGAVMEATPAFVKSIPIERARADDTIIALRMNDAELPLYNGFPARLVVPGWTATYWMKHITTLDIRATKLDNFWMKSAYRVPSGMFPGSPFPTQDTEANRPITDIVVNALATSHADGDSVRGAGFTLAGQAWDNGAGIERVEVSINGGTTWGVAMLGNQEGRFGFHPWSIQLVASPGKLTPMIRATSKSGAVQPDKPIFNPAGYHHNAVQTLSLTAI